MPDNLIWSAIYVIASKSKSLPPYFCVRLSKTLPSVRQLPASCVSTPMVCDDHFRLIYPSQAQLPSISDRQGDGGLRDGLFRAASHGPARDAPSRLQESSRPLLARRAPTERPRRTHPGEPEGEHRHRWCHVRRLVFRTSASSCVRLTSGWRRQVADTVIDIKVTTETFVDIPPSHHGHGHGRGRGEQDGVELPDDDRSDDRDSL